MEKIKIEFIFRFLSIAFFFVAITLFIRLFITTNLINQSCLTIYLQNLQTHIFEWVAFILCLFLIAFTNAVANNISLLTTQEKTVKPKKKKRGRPKKKKEEKDEIGEELERLPL